METTTENSSSLQRTLNLAVSLASMKRKWETG